MLEEGIGRARRGAVHPDAAAALRPVRRHGDAGAEFDLAGGVVDGRRDRPGAVARPAGDLVELRPAQTAARRQKRHRLEQVGLAGAVRPGQHDRPPVQRQRQGGVVAEAGQLERMQGCPALGRHGRFHRHGSAYSAAGGRRQTGKEAGLAGNRPRGHIGPPINKRKEVIQCLIVIRRVWRTGPGISPLARFAPPRRSRSWARVSADRQWKGRPKGGPSHFQAKSARFSQRPASPPMPRPGGQRPRPASPCRNRSPARIRRRRP